MTVTIPQEPLSEEQRAQLLTDMQSAIDQAQPQVFNDYEFWSMFAAVVYFLKNPPTPPTP